MATIFVGGCQRTGTSAVQQLLCQLPEANPYLYEASFLRMQVTCYAEAKTTFDGNHACYFGGLENLKQFQGGVIQAFLDHAKRVLGGCEHLVLKEPHLTILWPHLYELMPDARFLLMMRDPRDVIASMIQVGERQKSAGQDYLFARRDIRELCQHFVSFYGPALEFADEDEGFRDRLAVIHYENVMIDPRTALEQIAGFTDVPFDSIDPTTDPNSGRVDHDVIRSNESFSPWSTEVYGKRITGDRIGRYSQVLTPEETALVEGYLGDFFDWFSYTRQAA